MPASTKAEDNKEDKVTASRSEGNWFSSKFSGSQPTTRAAALDQKENMNDPQPKEEENVPSSKPSYTFDNMPTSTASPFPSPSPSLTHRKNATTATSASTARSKAQALSLTFMKSLSGICCEGCGKDPIFQTTGDDAEFSGGGGRNGGNDEHNKDENEDKERNHQNTPSGRYNLQALQHQPPSTSFVSQLNSTSISPLVMAPMMVGGPYSANDDPIEGRKQHHGMTVQSNNSVVEGLLGEYMCLCQFYHVPYNAGIITTLRFALPSLRVTGSFHDLDMVALVELLLRHANTTLRYIRRLDFTVASKEGRRWPQTTKVGFTSHGALALAKLLQTTQFVRQVWVPRHRIGPYGASALFLACKDNPTIQHLNLRRCRIGERGALVFCEVLFGGGSGSGNGSGSGTANSLRNATTSPATNEGGDKNDNDNYDNDIDSQDDGGGQSATGTQQHGLLEVDLSSNGIGHRGTRAIERAVKVWNAKVATSSPSASMTPIFVNVEGNLVFPEIMNGITHGLGIILSCIGGYLLARRVQDQSIVHAISCSVYTTSLLVLYMSSTLYHSFFSLQHIKYIFQVMDKCAIYVLIAGSYTPFLTVIFHDKPAYSVGLLGFIWTCCFLGIAVEACAPTWHYRPMFSLSMYLGMGWAAMVCLPEIAEERLPVRCIHLLILGGVGYTAGVPFFIRDNNLDHALWHLFVMSGSIFHWLAVYMYVAPTSIPSFA